MVYFNYIDNNNNHNNNRFTSNIINTNRTNMVNLSFPKFNSNKINIFNSNVSDVSKKTRNTTTKNGDDANQIANVEKITKHNNGCVMLKSEVTRADGTRNSVMYKDNITRNYAMHNEYDDSEDSDDSDVVDTEELQFSMIDPAFFVPRIVKKLPKRYASVVGAQAIFTCVTTVLFPVECQWYLNGNLIEKSRTYGRMYTRDRGKTLVILSLREDDHGELAMVACNDFGKVRTTCRLKVEEISRYDSSDDNMAPLTSVVIDDSDDVFEKHREESTDSDDSGVSSQTTNDVSSQTKINPNDSSRASNEVCHQTAHCDSIQETTNDDSSQTAINVCPQTPDRVSSQTLNDVCEGNGGSLKPVISITECSLRTSATEVSQFQDSVVGSCKSNIGIGGLCSVQQPVTDQVSNEPAAEELSTMSSCSLSKSLQHIGASTFYNKITESDYENSGKGIDCNNSGDLATAKINYDIPNESTINQKVGTQHVNNKLLQAKFCQQDSNTVQLSRSY